MSGLIQQQMGGAAAPENEAPVDEMNDEGTGEPITAEGVRSQLELPEELKGAYDKTVKAGLKLMFDPSMREETIAFMEGAGDPSEKLAKGITAVMITLWKESNQTMPPQVVVPAAIELLVHAAEVANASDMPIENKEVGEGIAEMVGMLLKEFGVDPEQMQGMITQMTGGAEGSAPAEAAPQEVV